MLLGISYVEWFGYLASVVVAASLTMSSIVKLRWANLVGSALFSTYGFIIGSLPVGLLNLFIVIVNILYLIRMYREKDDFRIMKLSGDDEFLSYFLECHRQDIAKFFPNFAYAPDEKRSAYYLVKNATPIGVLVGTRLDTDVCMIELDYVGPQYRDFKMGSFVYGNVDFFRKQGFRKLMTRVTGGAHDVYLERMQFTRDGEFYIKNL